MLTNQLTTAWGQVWPWGLYWGLGTLLHTVGSVQLPEGLRLWLALGSCASFCQRVDGRGSLSGQTRMVKLGKQESSKAHPSSALPAPRLCTPRRAGEAGDSPCGGPAGTFCDGRRVEASFSVGLCSTSADDLGPWVTLHPCWAWLSVTGGLVAVRCHLRDSSLLPASSPRVPGFLRGCLLSTHSWVASFCLAGLEG